MTDRITQLEETIAHQAKLLDELNAVVADQAKELDLLTRRVRLLLERAAEAEAEKGGGVVIGDERPPHY
ncbi:MAG: SlyX family protein [Pseudomonadota bacterium]